MTITYIIKPEKLYTHTLDGLTNVIKQVDWTITGTNNGVSFSLPNTTILADPTQQTFIPLSDITEQKVIEWIEAQDLRLPSIKQHIELVVNRDLEKKALIDTEMPWASPSLPPEVTTNT